MRRTAAVVVASSLFFACVSGCEKPRDRACRALVLQAQDAEAARTATASDPRLPAYRAQSVARWIRSNAVEDPVLKQDADELASALDRLADARMRLAFAAETLAARDATELIAHSEKVLAYADEREALLRQLGDTAATCRGQIAVPLAQQADQCAMQLDYLAERETSPEVKALVGHLRGWATWAEILQRRPVEETIAQARGVHAVIADRGRAESDVTRLAASLGTKCGS